MTRRLALSLVLALLLTLCGCARLLFYPSPTLVENPVAATFPVSEHTFPGSDGVTLHGRFYRAAAPKGTIVVFHGNAENLSTHVGAVLWLVKEGFNLFIFDYRGYGRSTGTPDLPGVHADGLAALDYLAGLREAGNERLILLGQSLGAGIAIQTAVHTPHRQRLVAVVADSPLASYRRLAREKLGAFWLTWPLQYPLSLLMNDDFSAERVIAEVAGIPLFIISDGDDLVVPPHHAAQLHALAKEPKRHLSTLGFGHIRSFAEAGLRRELASALTALCPPPP